MPDGTASLVSRGLPDRAAVLRRPSRCGSPARARLSRPVPFRRAPARRDRGITAWHLWALGDLYGAGRTHGRPTATARVAGRDSGGARAGGTRAAAGRPCLHGGPAAERRRAHPGATGRWRGGGRRRTRPSRAHIAALPPRRAGAALSSPTFRPPYSLSSRPSAAISLGPLSTRISRSPPRRLPLRESPHTFPLPVRRRASRPCRRLPRRGRAVASPARVRTRVAGLIADVPATPLELSKAHAAAGDSEPPRPRPGAHARVNGARDAGCSSLAAGLRGA